VLGLPDELAPESGYRPVARLAESLAAGPLAHAGMDTSDGCLHTLDQLARLNGVRIRLSAPAAQLLEPTALGVAAAARVPPLAMLAAHHGEFELVLAVHPHQAEAFTQALAQRGYAAIEVARAEAAQGAGSVCLCAEDGGREIPMEPIRNLLHESGGDLAAHARALVALLTPLVTANPGMVP
jgi:thiamine monophosphate kinase